jgi:transcriptional regulator with XRE-family HTH domain
MSKSLGQTLRALRDRKGLGLREAGRAAGIDAGNLRRYETDVNMPSLDKAVRLARVYGVTVNYLASAISE